MAIIPVNEINRTMIRSGRQEEVGTKCLSDWKAVEASQLINCHGRKAQGQGAASEREPAKATR